MTQDEPTSTMICPRYVAPMIGCRHFVPLISNRCHHVSRLRSFELLANLASEMLHRRECRCMGARSSQHLFQSSIGTASKLHVRFSEPTVDVVTVSSSELRSHCRRNLHTANSCGRSWLRHFLVQSHVVINFVLLNSARTQFSVEFL